MEQIESFCGFVFVASGVTQVSSSSGSNWLRRLTNKNFTCEDCLAFVGWQSGYCGKCETLACGMEHQIENCASCSEFPGCEKISHLIQHVPDIKQLLETCAGRE